jgi:hypothetical protein
MKILVKIYLTSGGHWKGVIESGAALDAKLPKEGSAELFPLSLFVITWVVTVSQETLACLTTGAFVTTADTIFAISRSATTTL